VYVYDPRSLQLGYLRQWWPDRQSSRTFCDGLSVVNVLAATTLQGSIEEFKAAAAGDFANNATTLETRTWLAAVFSRESTSPDFINRALAAISATTRPTCSVSRAPILAIRRLRWFCPATQTCKIRQRVPASNEDRLTERRSRMRKARGSR